MDMDDGLDAASTPLHPTMDKYLHGLLESVHGLQAIVVSNSYGVALLTVRSEDVDTAAFEGLFSSVFALASDQAEKLPFGTSKSTVAFFERCVLVQLDVCPLVVSLVAASDANVGALLDLAPQLKTALEPVRRKADDELS